MEDGRKEETIGRAVTWVLYIRYALRIIAAVSLAALAVLYFIEKPLWLAPIIGAGAFLIWRFFRRVVFRLIMKFVRWSQKK